MQTISEFLQSLGLEQYAQVFDDNYIDTDVLSSLSEADLEKLEIPMGHRKRLLKGIAQRRKSERSPKLETTQPVTAERRQLTVMFCDLVGSTQLSQKLDPESLRELMQSYQKTCAQIIETYEGYVAQYLGDGLMVYFGWPRAHEDDAERAVRAGLDIVDAVTKLDALVPLSLRTGIATGLVVVGGDDQSDTYLAVGETPNLAARIQGIAEPGSVVLADSTQRLVSGAFELEALGAKPLKGIDDAVAMWRVTGKRNERSRFEATHRAGLTSLVGRRTEIAMLMERWDQAKDNDGQVILLSGEPGIGKSRMTLALLDRVSGEPHIRLRYQCSPYLSNSAFHPIIDQLTRAAHFDRNDQSDSKLDKLEKLLQQSTEDVTTIAPLFAAILSLPLDRYPQSNLSPQRQKEETIAVMADQAVALSRHRPVLMIFEDVHWIDPSTLEVLNRLIDRIQDAAVLLVITYRPEFEAPWTGQGNVTLHSLNRLGRKHGTDMVARLTGDKVLPVEVLDEIIAKTDGVPLFVEELTRAVIDAGYLKETTNEYVIEGSLPSLAIPTTLQDSLTARLDRLGPIKEVAQIAACIGRRFSYELLSLVAPLNGDALSDALTQLSNKGIISGRGVPPTATYLFKHALVQDAAHESLLMKGRQRAHEAIANALEAHFPDTVTSHPEILAHHYTVADRSNRATPYWLAAGQLAVTRSANQEAIHHLSHGLELVRVTPPSRDRDQLELAFHVALGTPLSALKGHGSTEAGANYERAYEISQSLGESVERTAILYGLWVTSNTRAEHRKALDWADQILAFAADREARVTSMIGHRSRGTTLLYLGNLTAAQRELENAVSLYDPQSDADLAYRFVQDPEVASRCLLSWTSWLQGYPDKAAGHSNLAFRRSDEIGHSFTQIWPAFFCGIILRAWLGQESEVEAHLENQLPTLGQNNFWQFTKYYQITKPWIQARRIGQASVERMAHNKSELRRSGMNLYGSLFSGMIAESHLTNGHVDAALGVLDEAQADSDQTHERFMQAELHRIRGECLKSAKSVSNAEESFRTAMSIAIEQGAKSWELRASSSLARLWQMQGKSAEAHDLLAPVYNWFSEGFDTKDLQEAKALLGQLESKRAPH